MVFTEQWFLSIQNNCSSILNLLWMIQTLYPGGNNESNSSSESGLFLSSISLCQVYACNCSGVMDIKCPGVGVAIAIALAPVGVVPLGVMPPGVNPLGVDPPGVKPLGVDPPGVWLPINIISSIKIVLQSDIETQIFGWTIWMFTYVHEKHKVSKL